MPERIEEAVRQKIGALATSYDESLSAGTIRNRLKTDVDRGLIKKLPSERSIRNIANEFRAGEKSEKWPYKLYEFPASHEQADLLPWESAPYLAIISEWIATMDKAIGTDEAELEIAPSTWIPWFDLTGGLTNMQAVWYWRANRAMLADDARSDRARLYAALLLWKGEFESARKFMFEGLLSRKEGD